MSRREFSRKQRAEIILRATNGDGLVCCEGCGLILGRKPFEIDHTLAEWFVEDKSKPLTVDDGKLLGKACCHRGGKTQSDQRAIAKTKRQRDKLSGAYKPRRRSLSHPTLKRKISGEVVPR